MDWLYAVANSGIVNQSNKSNGNGSGFVGKSGVTLMDSNFHSRFYATMLGKYITRALKLQKEEAETAERTRNVTKPLSTAGIFGSVTIAGRNKQFKSSLNGKSSDMVLHAKPQLTAGQQLIRLRVSEVFQKYELDDNGELREKASQNGNGKGSSGSGSNSNSSSNSGNSGNNNQDNKVVMQRCEKLFHEAIRRRAHYDALKMESDRVLSLQQKRLQKEPGAVPTAALMGNNGINNAKELRNSIKEEEHLANIDEIDLEELVGGPITVVSAPSTVDSPDNYLEDDSSSIPTTELESVPVKQEVLSSEDAPIISLKRPLSMKESPERAKKMALETIPGKERIFHDWFQFVTALACHEYYFGFKKLNRNSLRLSHWRQLLQLPS